MQKTFYSVILNLLLKEKTFYNWELLDEICDKLGGKSDIWYATNTEIYDYATAFNSLIFSADMKKVYNPTLYSLWFHINDETIKITPGQTLCL